LDDGAPDCGHRGRYDDGRVSRRTSTRHGGVNNTAKNMLKKHAKNMMCRTARFDG